MSRSWKTGLVLVALVALAGGFAAWRQRQPLVAVTLEPAIPALGHARRVLTIVLRAGTGALGPVEVRLVQGATARPILTQEPGGREARLPLELAAAALGLQEGMAELHVYARDTAWRPRADRAPRLVHRFTVDLTPPLVELRAATGYVKHGGAGVVVYRVTGAARSGVQAGSEFFPGLAGLAQDAAVHVALFTVPYHGPQVAPAILAEDEAGNQRTIGVPVTFLPVRFPRDTIQLTEAFLRRKLPELAPQTPGAASAAELVQGFLVVNREGRKAAEAKIRDASRAPGITRPAWSGAFRQQPNSQVFANFPEERSYRVDGQVVDTQWHLGIDLASRKQSSVEASHAGRVAFTGANGIYGNMVVLDHGLGLASLYAHLSEIGVQVGQTVAQGESLGRSGETGLAGGDHLHFAMLVHGVYTTPLEWWDAHWLRDRVSKPLTDAGISLPGITDGALAAAPGAAPSGPPTRPPARPRRR